MLGLWSIIGEQNASRKFVDLIWRSSSKYAPFDPSVASIEVKWRSHRNGFPLPPPPPFSLCKFFSGLTRAQVGDYGTVDPKTGCFEKEGNIFSNEAFKPLVKGLSTKTLPLAQNQFMVVSLNAKQADADVSAKLDAARIAHAQFKVSRIPETVFGCSLLESSVGGISEKSQGLFLLLSNVAR